MSTVLLVIVDRSFSSHSVFIRVVRVKHIHDFRRHSHMDINNLAKLKLERLE